MVKFLISGCLERVEGDSAPWETLVNRIDALQNSPHGPFDCIFVAGSLFEEEDVFKTACASSLRIAIPLYAIKKPLFVSDQALPHNVHYLGSDKDGYGIDTLHELTVCWTNESNHSKGLAQLESLCMSSSYRGCDVLLSSSWPNNTHHFLDPEELKELRSMDVALGAGSTEVAKVALTVKPRYHFSGGDSVRKIFWARVPYTNPGGAHTTNARAPATRFISLGRVSATKVKTLKWMHALTLDPIVHVALDRIDTLPAGSRSTDCPYLDTVAVQRTVRKRCHPEDNPLHTIHDDKRFRADGQGLGTGVYFFGNQAHKIDGSRVPRQEGGAGVVRGGAQKAPNLVAHSTDAVRLFIGNLPRDYSDEQILQLLPGSVSIHRPVDKHRPPDPGSGAYPKKTFGFVEFTEHNKAAKVVEASINRGVMMGGRTVSVGWAAEKQNNRDQGDGSASTHSSQAGNDDGRLGRRDPQTARDTFEVPSDSTALFLGNLPPLSRTIVTSSGEVEEADDDLYGSPDKDAELLQTLRKRFVGITSFNRVTGKQYAFVEFASHAEAFMAWQMSDRGVALSRGIEVEEGRVLTVGWAKSSREASKDNATTATAVPLPPMAIGNVIWHHKGSLFPHKPVHNLLLEAPHPDASTLFLGNVPPQATETDLLRLFHSILAEIPDLQPSSFENLEIRHPEGKRFAFVAFSAPHIAAAVMGARTAPRDVEESVVPEWRDPGSSTVKSAPSTTAPTTCVGSAPLVLEGQPLQLGWAQGRAADKRITGSSSNASGTKGIPSGDHASSCWFCLKSPTLKTHLIISVAEHCYMAMPRGAMHPLHCLICPIDCVPSKIHLSTAATAEFGAYESCIESLYRQEGYALMSFERSVRTRGMDHMQTHIVPVPTDLLANAESNFHRVISRHNQRYLERVGVGESARSQGGEEATNEGGSKEENRGPLAFYEVPESEQAGIEELVLTLPGGPYQEYFCVSIPIPTTIQAQGKSAQDWRGKRFVYVHSRNDERDAEASSTLASRDNVAEDGCKDKRSESQARNVWRFPMQLGQEIAATILNEPQKAFWKSLVVPEEEEIGLSSKFKAKFAPLDFTND